MAEDDTLNRGKEDENAAPIVVPFHDPLPPPPEVHYTRPGSNPGSNHGLSKRSAALGDGASGSKPGTERESAAGHGSGLAAGLTFVTSILAGLLAGGWLDSHYIHSATPWGTMGMTLVGAAVGFTNMSRLLSRGGRRKP